MADITATSTATMALPVPNKKAMIVKTPSGNATSDTLEMGNAAMGGFATIDMVICFADDGTGGYMAVTWSGTTLTFGTITTGIHHLLVIGNAA